MRKTLIKLSVLCMIAVIAALGASCSKPSPAPQTPAAPETPAAPAMPEPAAETASKTIYLVGEQEFTPISFERDGQVVGINVDIIKEAFKRMGMEVKLELMPWERCKQMVLNGSADGFFSPYKTPEREKNYQFTREPLMVEKNVLAVAKDSNIEYDGDMKKMSPYTFGILIGYSTLEKFQAEGTITKIDESHTVAEALKKLTAGRGIDIYVNTDIIIKYIAKQEGLSDKIRIIDTPLSENPSYLAFTKTKDMSDIAAKFEAELENIKADGTYEKIIAAYVGE